MGFREVGVPTPGVESQVAVLFWKALCQPLSTLKMCKPFGPEYPLSEITLRAAMGPKDCWRRMSVSAMFVHRKWERAMVSSSAVVTE